MDSYGSCRPIWAPYEAHIRTDPTEAPCEANVNPYGLTWAPYVPTWAPYKPIWDPYRPKFADWVSGGQATDHGIEAP